MQIIDLEHVVVVGCALRNDACGSHTGALVTPHTQEVVSRAETVARQERPDGSGGREARGEGGRYVAGKSESCCFLVAVDCD